MSVVAEALDIVRFVHFAATMALVGIAAFRHYAFAGRAEDSDARTALDVALARTISVAAAVALVSALAMIPVVAAEMAGAAAATIDPAIWHTVLVDTRFGQVWCWHLGFAAVLLALCAAPGSRWQGRAVALVALLLLVSLAWVGHATEGKRPVATAHEVNQMVHLTSAAIWLGGLVPLGILLRRALGPDGSAYLPLARAALPHFSQIGYVAVALVGLTGAINGVFLVGSFHALAMTPYGRLLLLKIALFAAMVGLALVNRFRLMPLLHAAAVPELPLRALLRSVVAEQALGLAVLGVVAVLGTWPPAIHTTMGNMKM